MSLQYCSHLHCRPIVRDGANLTEAPNTPGEAHSEHKVIYHTGPFHLRESSPVGGFGRDVQALPIVPTSLDQKI